MYHRINKNACWYTSLYFTIRLIRILNYIQGHCKKITKLEYFFRNSYIVDIERNILTLNLETYPLIYHVKPL